MHGVNEPGVDVLLSSKRLCDMSPSTRKMRAALDAGQTRRTSIFIPALLLVSVFLSFSTSRAQHEAEFVCPNPDIHGDCERTDRSQEIVDDEQTLLDMFGDVAKEFLTQRVIPPTDADCIWDWRHARCELFCDCSFQPKWGDFHLGRSCRRRKQFHTTAEGKTKEIWWNGQDTCMKPPQTPYTKMSYQLIKGIKSTGKRLKLGTAHVAKKFTIKSRFGRARGDACTAWSERAETEGRELNEFQRKICAGKDARVKSSTSDNDENPLIDSIEEDVTSDESPIDVLDSEGAEMNAQQEVGTNGTHSAHKTEESEQTGKQANTTTKTVEADEGGTAEEKENLNSDEVVQHLVH